MQTTILTFEAICVEEPRLTELFADALSTHQRYPHINFDSSPIWYRMFKPQIRQLVGLECTTLPIATANCYEIAYLAIHEALSSPNPRISRELRLMMRKLEH